MAQTSITGGVSTQNIIPKDRFVSRLKQLLLSTIGLSDRRTQRMQSVDGSVVIFNGEIYNYKALRSKLEAEGYVFRTDVGFGERPPRSRSRSLWHQTPLLF